MDGAMNNPRSGRQICILRISDYRLSLLRRRFRHRRFAGSLVHWASHLGLTPQALRCRALRALGPFMPRCENLGFASGRDPGAHLQLSLRRLFSKPCEGGSRSFRQRPKRQTVLECLVDVRR